MSYFRDWSKQLFSSKIIPSSNSTKNLGNPPNSNKNLGDPPPKFLLINYNESGTSAGEHRSIKEEILRRITDDKENKKIEYDIICISTQESNSGTKNHMQHYLVDDMKAIGYKPLVKVDGTRETNTSMFKFRDEDKFMGVRTRFYILDDILHDKKTLESITKKSYQDPESLINKYNSGILTTADNKSGKIQIKRIQYIRLAGIDEGKRKAGDSSIIIRIDIQRYDKIYRYIICNYHSHNLNNISKLTTLQEMVKTEIKDEYTNPNNKQIYLKKANHTYVLFVSQDIIKFKTINKSNSELFNPLNSPIKDSPENNIFFCQLFRPTYIPIKIKLLIKDIIDDLLKGSLWYTNDYIKKQQHFLEYYFNLNSGKNKKDLIIKINKLYSTIDMVGADKEKIGLIDNIGQICLIWMEWIKYKSNISAITFSLDTKYTDSIFMKFYKMYLPIDLSKTDERTFKQIQNQIEAYIERIVLYWKSINIHFTKDYINSCKLFTQKNIYNFIKDKCILYKKFDLEKLRGLKVINESNIKLIDMWLKIDSIYISNGTQTEIDEYFKKYNFST